MNRIVWTTLRGRGFTGSFPHLRRIDEERVSLLSVQHHSSGGSFVVEVAACAPEGLITSSGKRITPGRLRAVDINDPRPRLGNPNFPGQGDHWYQYGPRSYEPSALEVRPVAHYERIARAVVDDLANEAEHFWRSFRR